MAKLAEKFTRVDRTKLYGSIVDNNNPIKEKSPRTNTRLFGKLTAKNPDTLKSAKDIISEAVMLLRLGLKGSSPDDRVTEMLDVWSRVSKGGFLKPLSPTAQASFRADDTPSLPDRAPALWAECARSDTRTPAQFIQETYGPWIGKGLTRAFLLQHDKPLYKALANWLRSNELPFDLPTKKELTNRAIEAYREKGSAEGMSAREYLRVKSAMSKRPPEP